MCSGGVILVRARYFLSASVQERGWGACKHIPKLILVPTLSRQQIEIRSDCQAMLGLSVLLVLLMEESNASAFWLSTDINLGCIISNLFIAFFGDLPRLCQRHERHSAPDGSGGSGT
mmetsp:Transcript_23767/g.37155  ORF Transcript_23767/g.37155 Transcript_23767/m.37155 type:complete len:117 (+) Transcript_23767:874-1224(+)